MREKLPGIVVDLLLKSGWFPERDALGELELRSGFELFPEAERILREFGGLRIGSTGAGLECAKSDVNLQPKLGGLTLENLSEEIELAGQRLYQLGKIQRNNWYLLVGEDGRIYINGEEFLLFADTFEEALTYLLLGKRSKFDPAPSR